MLVAGVKAATPIPARVWLWIRKDTATPLVRVSAFPSML